MSNSPTPPFKGGVPPLVKNGKPPSKVAANKTNLAKKPKNSDKPNFASELLAMRDQRMTKRKAYRKVLRNGLVRACEIGVELTKSSEAWATFMAADWGKLRPPKKGDRKDALRWAIKFWMGEGKANQKKASFYHSAVADLIAKKLSSKQIKEHLKQYGLKRLQKDHTNTTKRELVPPSEAASRMSDGSISWHFTCIFDDTPHELFAAHSGTPVVLSGTLGDVRETPVRFHVESWTIEPVE